MHVTSLRVRNYRCFEDTGSLDLGPINVLIGANNAGKSTLIRALALMQQHLAPPAQTDVRIGEDSANIHIGLQDLAYVQGVVGVQPAADEGQFDITISRQQGVQLMIRVESQQIANAGFPSTEPHNFIVPYFARRKTAGYQQLVNRSTANQVVPTLQNLPAKLQRLSSPALPGAEEYRRTCEEVLGYQVTAVMSEQGLEPGMAISPTETIPIDAMGEGVPHIVGLLAELALAEGKLFLIEELESDIHPQALKLLLGLIVSSSSRNQFVLSTHSNVVLRHLGAVEGTRVLEVRAERAAIPPRAWCQPVASDPGERIRVLEDLGYELYDFDLWDGWLILEESSAERIIRDYLIPWFAPGLAQRVRTVSVNGNSNVEPAFEDFNRLFRFTHLETRYRNRAWVVIDGDDEGRRIVSRLREKYGATWEPDQFRYWSEPQFEIYYPACFRSRVTNALEQSAGRQKREAKLTLLENVRAWVDRNPSEARREFASSAAEVIQLLRAVDGQLFGPAPTA